MGIICRDMFCACPRLRFFSLDRSYETLVYRQMWTIIPWRCCFPLGVADFPKLRIHANLGEIHKNIFRTSEKCPGKLSFSKICHGSLPERSWVWFNFGNLVISIPGSMTCCLSLAFYSYDNVSRKTRWSGSFRWCYLYLLNGISGTYGRCLFASQ